MNPILALAQAFAPGLLDSYLPALPTPAVDSAASALARPCPRCKAEPGAECDRRTLGGRRFHGARVQRA